MNATMTIAVAKAYLNIFIAAMSSMFSGIARAILASFEAATNRMAIYVGLTATVATAFQVYLAVQTAGASLLLAPLMIALDIMILTTMAIVFDAAFGVMYKAGSAVVNLVLSRFRVEAATQSHKRAYARAAGVGAVH
jgi:hypothetical protein